MDVKNSLSVSLFAWQDETGNISLKDVRIKKFMIGGIGIKGD